MAAVTDALQRQYSSNILLLSQQLGLTLAPTVHPKPDCSGEMAFQDQLASETAQEKTARNQDVVNTDPQYARRKIVPRYFYMAPLLDSMDKVQLVKDPTNAIVMNNAAALARAKDGVIATAFFATAYSGKDGTTSNTVPSTQIIVHSSAGMNMVKIREAKKILDANEVPKTDRFLAVSAEQVEDLLAITQVTSSDYAQVKALVDGQPGTLAGFKVVQTERLTDDGSTTRYCAAYHKSGLVLGTWIDLKASIDILPGKHFSAQIYAGQSYGATRLEEEKIVKVECTE